MSSDNEFPIPFGESRRGLAANQEQKAAVGRLGQYLASRGVDRPTIGEGRKKRRLGNIELPTGGKPGKRKPTGSRLDVDGDGWADEGTSKPVWVGIDGQGKKPKQGTESPKPSSSSSKRKLSSGFYNLIAIETDESTPEKLESLKEQLGDALVSHETSTVDIGARGKSNVRKKHTFRLDNSGLRNTYAHNYATNRGFVAQIEAAPSETRLSSGMTQLSKIEVYDYGKLKAAKKVRSTQQKGKEEDYWIVLDKDGEVRAYLTSAVDERRKKLLDNFNQQGENPFNGKKSPLSIDDIDMQDVLRAALDDKKMKIIAALETWYVEDRNEVFQINTRDGHRRRGIAAEMFNTHREVFPERDLQHSDALSEDGKAFSAATPATSVSGRFSSGRDINAKLNLERYGENEESAYVSSFEIGSKKFSVSRGGDSPGRNMYNGYLVAFDDDGKNAGYIDYNSDSVDKTATVAMTEVTEEYKRMGVASALLDSLLIDLPGYEISPGYTTDEGSAWWRRVTGGDGPIKAERKTRLSSGATARRVGTRNIYDKSVDYNDKRNPSGLLETSRDGKEYSSIRFNGDGYDIKTSESEDGFSVFIEDESGQIASLTFSEAPTGEVTKLLSYKASKESQKAGVPEALLDHVLVKNPDTNITSSEETRRWFNYVNNGTADYGAKGFRKYGFSGKYIDGEDVLRDGDYTLESDLLLKTSNVSSSPVVGTDFSKNEYTWNGQVFKIGNESIVFGAHEEAQFDDGIKKLPLNPCEILKLDPSSAEGRKAAARWYSAVHGADVSVLAESNDFNASSYVSALLYAASKGDKDAQKEFDEFVKYSDSLLEKLDSKLSPIENPEKALPLDSRLIHQTSYKPTIDENGYLVVRPLEDFPQTAKDGTEVTVNRTTLHFAINHLAEGHMFRKETGGESYVVISSLDSFIKQNPDSLENFNIVDTAASPPPGDGLRFPPGSYKLVEVKEGEDGRKKVEDILRADGVEVFVGGERNSGTPGADEAGRIRARMLGVSPSVASDLTLANLEQINRTNISDQRQYADVPSSTSFFQEASKNALLRIANRKENTWVSASRKLKDKDPLGDSKFRLASGKAPRYPREPTLGAFLEGAEERFDGVNSWEEFKERYNDTEMVFLDYETTGLDFDEFGKATTNGNPTQIGLVRMKNGEEIGRLNLFMNPEQPLGEWSLANLKDADGNPITNEWLTTQMPMAEAHRQVAEFIGPDAIIGVQNATFDKRVLEDALEREGIDWRPSGYLDTRDISAMTLPVWSEESPEGPYITDRDGNKKPSSSLAAITEYLDVELGEGHHNADADAFATSQVMQKIIDRAIENGWSTGVLDKEKRDSKLKADNDKFNADAEKFELDKEAFVATQEEESSKLSSGRQREMIPMNVPSKKREGAGATGYRTQDSSGNLVSRHSSTWLAGLSSEEISKVVVPVSADEHFEMWADDIAGPNWRTSKKQQKFIKNYYAELQKDSTNIPVDYSPESVAATQTLVKDLLDSSPSVMWVMQNFGAPLIVPFTREGMDAYENSPDMKERLALLAKQRGTEKIPFVSGLANRSLGSIGISPRALIDRESLLNDDKGVYPISMDPDRVPAPRDAHIDRSLEGTIVHEFGHWIHHRALWDTETNGASGKMRSYYGTGKLSDPRYTASLDVAEEYGDYETDDKRIEIYSQFIDLTGRSPEEMFRAHPDEPLLSTSYGNINKREAMAEAFVAIMHPNKEMPGKTLSKKLRKDIYTLIGVDEKDLPWSDSEAGSENRLSSGVKKEKRKTIFSRFRKEETEEETVEGKRKTPVVERPEGLVSFAPEPSEELLKVSPVPDEQTLKNEVLRDVQSLALEFNEGAYGGSLSTGANTKASVIAKKTIASNLSRSVDFDVEDFINLFATDEAGFGFHTTETFAAVQKMYETLKSLPVDATSEQRKVAARGAFDARSGRIISAKIHDDILGRARYYDEILDKLETKEFDEIFGPLITRPPSTNTPYSELVSLDGSEKSLFTPYLMTKLGTDDIKRELLEELSPRFHVLNNLISEIKENNDKAFGLARIGEINPETGEQDYALISFLGRGVDKNIIDAILSLDIGAEDYGQKFADIMSAFNGQLTGQKLIQIREAGLTKIDSSNIDSPEIQKAIKEHLLRNVRARAGNFESKKESYTKKTGVVFFDLETTEGKRLVREALVSDLIHTWAISANNANPVALAIQHEIRKMFGLDEAMGWSTSPLKALRPEEKEGMLAHQFDGAPELTDAQTAMIRPILQKIYDSTQLYYKTKGITHIPVYRGFTQSDTELLPNELESMETVMRPLSSWATNMDVARSFSGQSSSGERTPTLIKSFVSVEDVFSHALSGFGCLNEDEVVLLGKPMKVIAVRTDDIEVASMDAPEQQNVLEKLKNIDMTNIDETFKSIVDRKESISKTRKDVLKNAEQIEELLNSGSDMQNMDLRDTDLTGRKLTGANLSGAKMQLANMRDVDLSGANLSGADLTGAKLIKANLTGTNLTGVNLKDANLDSADLTGADLTGADLTDADLQRSNLTDTNLTRANFPFLDLIDANLPNANLTDAYLTGTNLTRANLRGANLTGASMVNVYLNGADLSGANLSGADLTGADLSGANLNGAKLTGARLSRTDLKGADLRGIDLAGIDLTKNTNLNGTLFSDDLTAGALFPEEYSVQKLSSGKKSHTPKWKTVEEIVDFEVLGASPDDSEEDRDDIVKESVGGDWMQWDPCREIRTAAYELAGIDEYSERDPNISQSGGFFGNSKFETVVSPEKRTEQARYLMASIVDSLIYKGRYEKQPYLYRAMMFSSPEEGKQFFDAMQVGSQVDIPLLAFVEIGPSPSGDHFLTRFGNDALLVLEDFPGSYQTGGTFEPVFSSRHESDTLYNVDEFAEAILADIENGVSDEENIENDTEFANRLIKLVDDYQKSRDPAERRQLKTDIKDTLDEVGNETIKLEWEGELLPEDHDEYYAAMEDEDTGMTPREFVSGGRLEVVSVKPDPSKTYRQIITLRQVGAFDPQKKGALVLKADEDGGTRLSSGKNTPKKVKPRSVELHDDEFEKKFNQKVPEGDGDCFSEAIQQARKLADAYDKVKIVHGYPLGTGGEAEGLRFPHAWAEFERDGLEWVRDYSNGNRVEFPKILYYAIGNIEEEDVLRYDIKEAEANMLESKHYGPW